KRAVAKGVDEGKVMFFPNWSGAREFKQAVRDDSLLASLGMPKGARVVLYSGNIGEKQGLEVVVDAAHQLAAGSQQKAQNAGEQLGALETPFCILIVGE